MSAKVKLRTHLYSSIGCSISQRGRPTTSKHLIGRQTNLCLAGAVAALLAMPSLASAQEASAKDEVFTLKTAVTLPAGSSALASFDISWVDGVLKKYYLGDRSNKAVDVIDTETKAATQIKPVSATATPNTFVGARGIDSVTHLVCGPPTGGTCVASNDVSGPDGVMTVENKQIWVGDGNSRVWVLDASSGNPVTVPAGATNPISTVRPGSNPNNRADELCYDSADHLVMVANNADDPPFASIISTDTYKVVKQIPFDGSNGAPKSTNGAEQCVWSPRTGKFYISIPGVNDPDDGTGAVAVIDPKTLNVVDVFPIPVADCAAPQGMAVGPDSQILLGCNAPSPNGHRNTAIINERSGSVVGRLPDLGGNDEVWFNEGDGHYFLAGGQNLNEQLGVVDSTGHKADAIVPTASNPNATGRRAHSVAADPNKNEVYLPVPATSAAAPNYDSTLCGTSPTAKAAGCIAVFSTTNNDHPRPVQR